MTRWYVVQTQSRAEQLAVAHLRRQGFEAYLPLIRKLRRHARRTELVDAPLFPRYAFVALDLAVDRWRSVNGTVGIVALVRNGDVPMALPDDVVPGLRAREDEAGMVALADLVRFDPGARFEVIDGAFAGHVGIYERMSPEERVVLLFELLGREVRVSVPIHAVRAA